MDAKLSVEVGAKIKELVDKMGIGEKSVKDFATNSEKSLKSVQSSFSSFSSLLAGIGIASTITDITKQVFSATAEFQKFQAVLSNTLGSKNLADGVLKDIQEFASKTPFAVQEVTAAFVKLANQGFQPTTDELRKLGDLASSTGKGFDQLAEAIIDAQVGEFERLKEFGIRAKDAGDKVTFTYKGVQTQVEKTSEAIRGYITGLGDAEGTSGAMAKISETLGGKLSNLRDNWDALLITVGSNTKNIFSGAIDVLSQAVSKITAFNKQLGIAEQFNLKQDFGLNFNQGSLNLDDVNGQVKQVENAQKTVAKYVNSIKDFAKTPEEFKNATKSLALFAKEQVKGINDVNLAKAIATQYADGIRLLQDLSNQAGKPKSGSANFGTGKKTKTKLTDEQKAEIEQQKRFAQYKVDGNAFAGKLITDSIERNAQMEVEATKKANSDLEDALKGLSIQNDPLEKSLKARTDTLFTESAKQVEILKNFNQDASDVINNDIYNTFGGIGDAIASALSGSENAITALSMSLLGSLGRIVSDLGELAIATGVGIKAIKVALKSLNPVVAIGAGIALVALGKAITSSVSKLGSDKMPGFATGVNNFRGGLALVGEKGPEIVNLPQGADVIPNHRTKGMFGGGDGFIAETRVDLDAIWIGLKRIMDKRASLG